MNTYTKSSTSPYEILLNKKKQTANTHYKMNEPETHYDIKVVIRPQKQYTVCFHLHGILEKTKLRERKLATSS